MSKKPKANKKNPKAERFEKATMPERVRLAMPLARQIVLAGIHGVKTWNDLDIEPDDSMCAHAAERLLGFKDDDYQPDDQQRAENSWLVQEAAFVLGIAAGLMMRPEAIKGGTR